MIANNATAVQAAIWRLIWPEICAHCRLDLRGEESVLCHACAAALRSVASPFCPACHEPDASPRHIRACLSAPAPCRLIRAVSLYKGPALSLVHAFKYGGRKRAAAWAGLRMARALDGFPELGACDALVPVPLHARRARARGYNQAKVLAEAVSALSGKPILELLQRRRATVEQWRLTRRQRLENLAGAFAAAPEAAGLRLLLIDDVCTTGASLHGCAKALLGAGAASVNGYAFAREALG